MTNYERGRQYEYRSMRYLESAGYTAYRMAGSHGHADVIGLSATGLVLVQVKFNCKPSPAELEQFKLMPVPLNCLKLVHQWKKGARAPIIHHL